MKYLILCLLSIYWSLSASALRCWTCENANSPRECFKSGHSKQCRFLEKVCQTEVRYSVGWGDLPIIRTGCKQPHACGNNEVQNPRGAWLPTQCNGGKFNSVCRCCCTGNHCNRQNLLCKPLIEEVTPSPESLKDVENAEKPTSRPEPSCARFPIAPQNGSMKCKRGKFVGSVCTFSCNAGYKQLGSRGTTCVLKGKKTRWNRPTPTCQPICQGEQRDPKDGRVECHGGGEVGTNCTFSCADGHKMQGESSVICNMTDEGPKWSSRAPACVVSDPQCPHLGKLNHGIVSCSRPDNGIGTECQFQCTDGGYSLLPIGRFQTTCVEKDGKARWNYRKPCCNAQCPPIAKKDIVIVIDSSRSISNSEWRIMKDFVTQVIRTFEVSEETVKFAVYRFNGRVDTASQILFGDYANIDELVDGVKNLPKTGGGTRIGRALRHARDYVLKHENRDDAEDMVWILTDGKSKDEFEDVAQDLRNSGVEIIALGVSRTGEEEFMDQLKEMTGDEELVIDVKDVTESFSDELVDRVSSKICEVSCE